MTVSIGSINLNSVKNGLVSAYHIAAAKTSEWLGRGIAIIQSGTEKALPYLQNKRIAGISLVAVSLIVFELGMFFGNLVENHVPNRLKNHKDSIGCASLIGFVVVGIGAFSKYTNLPFSPMAITGISVGSIFLRIMRG